MSNIPPKSLKRHVNVSALTIKGHVNSTSVYDRGRRGMPLPGCDCVQCFGYCIINNDDLVRARALGAEFRRKEGGDFDGK